MIVSYTIGKLAAAAKVPVSTVRYYERSGLLVPDARTDANYRVYGRRALERLRFIRAAQASGFSLVDVARLLALRDGTGAPCREVQDLIEGRLADLDRKLADLRRLRSVLRSSLKMCQEAEAQGACAVMDDLAQSSARPSARRGRRPWAKKGKKA